MIVSSILNQALADEIVQIKQDGYYVRVMYTGDSPPTVEVPGVTVLRIGRPWSLWTSMNQYSRTSAIIAVVLFLESCAFYLVFKIVSVGLDQDAAALPFWLVLVAVFWAFLLSHYAQTFKFSANLRGVAGLGISLVSLLGLSHLKTGFGLVPVGAFLGADLSIVFYQVFIFGFLVLLWWRGSTIAQDDVTLDVVRSSFQWGLIVMFAAVVLHSVSNVDIVNGFLILGSSGLAWRACHWRVSLRRPAAITPYR